MTTYVLVHGAWYGAWAWDRVVPLLEKTGARTVVPELSAGAEVGLDDHADEITAVLESIDDDALLVGHSYAGLVVRQAADQRPDRVRHIVLVEGWAGPGGSSLFGLAPDWFAERLQPTAVDGELPTLPASLLGVEDVDDVRWVEQCMRTHPLRTFTDPTRLTGAVDQIPGTGIYGRSTPLPFADLARALGYRTVPMDGPHSVMITDPELLADLLLEVRRLEA